MKSLRKFLAILLAVSCAVPLDAAPLRGRLRTRLRERQATRQTQAPQVAKTQGFDPAVAREQIGGPVDPVVASASGINDGGIQPGGGGGEATSIGGGSPIAGAIVGNSGDVLGWSGSAWDDLTIQAAIVAGLGNGTDNQVITSDGAGGVAWEAAGGGLAVTGTPAAGDSVYYNAGAATPGWYLDKPVFDVTRYGAGTDYRQTMTSGSNANGTTINVESGQGSYLKAGNSVVIPGAGAAHQWAAVTPDTPNVTSGGSTTFTGGAAGSDIITTAAFLGVTSGATFTRSSNTIVAAHLGVADGHSCYLATTSDLPGTLATGTEYFLRQVAGSTTDYQLHATRAGAIANTGQLTIADAGSGTHTLFLTLPVRLYTTAADLPSGASEATTYWLRPSTTAYQWTLHTTATGPAANADTVDLADAGTGTHSLYAYGGQTYTYSIIGNSGAGGYTVKSSAGSSATCPDTLTGLSTVYIDWDAQVDGSSNPVHGYVVYCDRTGGTRHLLTRVNGAGNAFLVTHQAGGYTNCVPTDVGKTVVYGATDRGTLTRYDNATRTWVVKADNSGTPAYFPAASACTITGGVGAGTVTGTTTKHFVVEDHGDTFSDADYEALCWKTGHEEQMLQISGTPTSGTYSLFYGPYECNVAYNASSATLETALRLLPGLSGVAVSTRAGTGANLTHTIRFSHGSNSIYGMGDVPELSVRDYTSGGTHAITICTTRPGRTVNEGDFILHPPTDSGFLYECVAAPANMAYGPSWRGDSRYSPTIGSTLNTTAWTGRGVRWQRVNSFFPTTEPSAAEEDAYFGTVTAISTDALTVNPATDTTVADDTPVFRNDLPAWQAAHAALIAQGHGTIRAPSGRQNWYTRVPGTHSEWKLSSGGANINYCLFEYEAGEVNYTSTFQVEGTQIFWRPLEVSAFRNDGTDSEQTSFTSIFIAQQSNRLGWFGGTIIYAPASEPMGEDYGCQHSVAMFRTNDQNLVNEGSGGFRIDDFQLLGLPNGMGTIFTDGEVPGATPLLNRVVMRYGGNGHDAGMGPVGKWMTCRVEGTNSRYRSTGLYTNTGDQPVSLWDCHLFQIGYDGVRMRNRNFEMRGGSIYVDKRVLPPLNNLIGFESTAPGGRVDGATFVSPSIDVDIQCDDITLNNNVLYNTFMIATNCDRLSIRGNKTFLNDGLSSTGSEKAIQIDAGCADVIIDNNIIKIPPTNGLTNSNGGISINGAGTDNVIITGNDSEGGGSSGRGLLINSTFVGNAIISNNRFMGSGVGNPNLLQAGNGAVVKCANNIWTTDNSGQQLILQGTSSARYEFHGDTFLQKVEVAAALTGYVEFDHCNFKNGSFASVFLDAGTACYGCDFAIEPTQTGALLNWQGNKVAGSLTKAVTLSASQNNYAWPTACDTILVDANAAYSITGIVPYAKGCKKTIANVDSSDVLTLSHISASSTAANKVNITAGADLALGSLDGVEIIATGNGTAGWSQD